MPKTRVQKEAKVQDLVTELQSMKSMVFANYEKLTVQDIEALRKLCKAEGVSYTVAKKTLLKQAFAQAGLQIDPKGIEGNFATLIAMQDEVAPAKIAVKFAKDHEALTVKGGVLEGALVDAKAILALSKLPGKQELLAKLVGSINAPVSGFVNVLAGNLRGLVTVLTRIQEKAI